jgi:hypothetical protein
MKLVRLAPAALLVVGCDTPPTVTAIDGGGPPPLVCKTPASLSPIHFTDVTSDYGLDDPSLLSNSVIAADFDGDGWSDIVITTGWSQAGNFVGAPTDPHNGMRVRHLFMSRPNPQDATKRVFVDATDSSGILASPSGSGERGFGLVNAGDVNNDGFVDLITCPEDAKSVPPNGGAGDDVEDGCAALLNDGSGHFALAPGSDLGKRVFWVPSGALLDYDRDGLLDFWPATVAHWPYPITPPPPDMPPTLFRGNGDGTFQNVSKAVGLPTADGFDATGTSFRHVFGIVACDIDSDGDDDIVFADYGRQENQVWLNDGGHFTNVAHQLLLDYDGNEDYTDDQSYLCWCEHASGANCPSGTPKPAVEQFCTVFGQPYGRGWEPGVTDQPYSLGGNYFSFACGDIDDNGTMDLMGATIVHGDVGQSSDPSELILNPGDGSSWVRPGNAVTGLLRPESGIYWNHGDNLVVFADLDLDGRKDIFLTDTAAYDASGVVEDSHNYLWHQKGDGTFEEVIMSTGLLGSNKLPHLEGPAFIDIDGDGDLDMVTGDSALKLHVFRNDSGQEQNSARIRLVGAGQGAANVSAIGAVVTVSAGGRTQTQYVSGGYGHGNNQNDLVLTFGLGSGCSIDSIDVRWPDATGSHSTFTNVEPNYTVTLHQGSAQVQYQ